MGDLEMRQASAHIYAGTGAALTRENGCGGRRISSNKQLYASALGTDTARASRYAVAPSQRTPEEGW